MKKFKSIRSHFTFYMLILLAVFSSLLIAISYSSARNIRESFAIQYSNMYSRSVENRIANMITKNVNASLQMSQSPAILKWIKNYYNPVDKQTAFSTLNNFKNYLATETDIFIAIHSNLHYYFNNKYINTLNPAGAADKWYRDAIKSREKFILNIDYNTALKTTKLWINVPIRENGKVIVIIGTGEAITLFLKKVLETAERGTSLILADKNGLIKAHKNLAFVDKKNIYTLITGSNTKVVLQNIFHKLENQPEQLSSLYMEYGDSTHYTAVMYLKNIRWFLMYFVKIDEIVKISQFFPLILTGVFSIIILFLFILFLTNKIIIKPLAVLTRTTENITAGNFNIQMDITSEDELGKLTKTFNRMTSTIKDYTDNLEKKVRDRTQELHEKNALITESINYAKTIQSAFLPQDNTLKQHLKEYFVYYQPRDIVGGDFYWFKPTPEGGFLLAVADCTGHGVPGSLITMIAGSSLNMITDRMPEHDPAGILVELDKTIRNTLHQDKETAESNDGLEIGLCYYHPEKKSIIFSGSKISLFYFENGIHTIKGDRFKLGYKNKNTEIFDFTNHSVPVKQNTIFYLSTDGFFGQNGEENEFPFGRSAFCTLLEQIHEKPLQEQMNIMDSTLKKFMGNKEQRDDITVLGFKI